MSNDTNLFVCADCNFNRAVLSKLLAEEHTQQLLEIPLGKCDYRVVLSKLNLRASHLWSCMEEVKQDISIPPLELVLPILHQRHAIHVVFGSSNLQPLIAGELLLVEDIMSGKFNFPSAKEAKAFSEGAASAAQ